MARVCFLVFLEICCTNSIYIELVAHRTVVEQVLFFREIQMNWQHQLGWTVLWSWIRMMCVLVVSILSPLSLLFSPVPLTTANNMNGLAWMCFVRVHNMIICYALIWHADVSTIYYLVIYTVSRFDFHWLCFGYDWRWYAKAWMKAIFWFNVKSNV